MPQWSAAHVVDFLGYYVEMIRAAEQTNVAVPCALNVFLEKLGQKYLECGFGTPAAAEPAATNAAQPPTGDSSILPDGTPSATVPKPKQPRPRRVTKAAAPTDTDWNRPDREAVGFSGRLAVTAEIAAFKPLEHHAWCATALAVHRNQTCGFKVVQRAVGGLPAEPHAANKFRPQCDLSKSRTTA